MKRLTSLFVAVVMVLALSGVAAGATVYSTPLNAASEVPPNESLARGTAMFKVSDDGTEIQYRLLVANIENVVAAHIHLAPAETNGPVVAFLFGPAAPGGGSFSGVIATGTITAANLIGPLTGQPLSALIDAIEAGNAYVNVHTNDGDPTTPGGPGDLPGGEIRGQL